MYRRLLRCCLLLLLLRLLLLLHIACCCCAPSPIHIALVRPRFPASPVCLCLSLLRPGSVSLQLSQLGEPKASSPGHDSCAYVCEGSAGRWPAASCFLSPKLQPKKGLGLVMAMVLPGAGASNAGERGVEPLRAVGDPTTEHRAPSTEHRAPGTEHRAPRART